MRHRAGDRRQPKHLTANAASVLHMPRRGRSRGRGYDNQIFQLSQLDGAEEEDEEDIHPDSDSAFLRRHRLSHESDSESDIDEYGTKPGIISRVIAFMSRSTLLGGSSSANASTAYGALSGSGKSDEDIRERDKRKAKSSALRTRLSNESPNTRRRRQSYSVTSSPSRNHRLQNRTSSPSLIAEPGHPAGQGGHLGGGLPSEVS